MNIIFFLLACGTKNTDTSSESDDTNSVDTAQSSTEPSQPSTEPSEEPQGPDIASLNNVGGCSDYFVYTYNDTDTQTLHISGTGIAQQAHEQSSPLSLSYTINPETDDIQPVLRYQTGENLNHASCNDAIIPGMEPVVTHEWNAISGTVLITVTPTGEATDWGEYPSNIEIIMENIEFSNEQGDSFPLPEKTITTSIGWMPG